MAFHQAEKTVGAQCLHQTLHCTEPQLEIELTVVRNSSFELARAIVCDQLGAFCFCED